jgi:hypothetical protein
MLRNRQTDERLAAMAKYHIALRTETTVWKTLDVERASLTDLRTELARFVGELLNEHARKIWVDEDCRVDVTDESGLILYVMHVSASQAPATAAVPVSGS